MPCQQPLHGWKKHDGGCEQCRCSIDGIPKGGRGTNAQGEIPDYAAAYGSDEAKNHDPKDVHVLFYGYHGAGYGEGDGTHQIQNDDKYIQRSVSFFM